MRNAKASHGAVGILAAALALGGCVGAPLPFDASVTSLARCDALSRRSYVLLPGEKGVEEGDLQYLEFAGYVDLLLTDAGFKRAASIGEADLVLYLGYGIGNPEKHVYSYSIPTWGQTGAYSGTTRHTPSYGVTGYTTGVDVYTTFTRFLRLDAYDAGAARESKKLEQVWSTTTVSVGTSGDLRRVFPYMVAASRGRLAQTSSQAVEVSVGQGDPFVTWLRQRNAPAAPVR